MDRKFYTWENFEEDVEEIVKTLKRKRVEVKQIFAVPKGGLVLGVKLANMFEVPLILKLDDISMPDGLIVVDDISDTGETLSNLPIFGCYTVTLTIKKNTKYIPDIYVREYEKNEWVVFPWEDINNETKKDGTFRIGH